MAIFGPFKNAQVTINSIDHSDHVKQATLTTNVNMLDATAMADSTTVNTAGIKSWTITVDLIEDFAASDVDSKMWGIWNSGSAVAISLVPSASASVAATNPNYNGSAVLENFPVGGAHGNLAMKAGLTFRCAGDLARSTS